MSEDWQNGGFGLYIHWPFCEAKCPYCDFNSHVSREIDELRWKRAYFKEISKASRALPDRILNTVFFGGGTPSLMHPDTVAEIIEHVRKSWRCANDLEVTLEANPGSVEAGRFAAYAQGGINRVSMGVQALNNDDLKRLGRIHDVTEAQKAFDIARTNFGRVSFDLIYARQGQTLEEWKVELNQALNMAVDHLSLYQLTIEPGTAFALRQANGGLRDLPGDELASDMYLLTQDVCSSHGFDGYEISNHARRGAESRHNLTYWRYGDYVGIGPGAHGRLSENGRRFATEAFSNPDRWLSLAESGETTKVKTQIPRTDQADEYLMMSMRLTEGCSLSRYENLSGKGICPSSVDHLKKIGMIEVEPDRIKATRQGRIVLNAVLQELLSS